MDSAPLRETVRELSKESSESATIGSPPAPTDNDEEEMTETEQTNHLITNDIPKEPTRTPPRKLYHPDSFLSQSTGQELPSQSNHSSNSSMIFQQSGVNLNLQRNSMTPLTMTKTNSNGQSQPTIERQSSYLSFKAPDRLVRGNVQPGLYQQSRLSSQTLPSGTPIGTPTNNIPISELISESTSPVPPPTASSSVPVGNPEDDMDFSSFLNSSQPQTSSRTQQKLWLQRETIASLNDVNQNDTSSPISNISTRFKYEEVARSYMHIRRTGNPVVESLKRLDYMGPNHFKVRKPVESPVNEDTKKLKIDLSSTNDLVDSLWKKSIELQMTTPPVPIPNPIKKTPTSPVKSASELFHMGQRNFGSQQKFDSIPSRSKFNRSFNDNSTIVSSPLSSKHQ